MDSIDPGGQENAEAWAMSMCMNYAYYSAQPPGMLSMRHDAAKASLATVTPSNCGQLHRFRKHLYDPHEYLKDNWKSLTNYAYAHRNGLRISSAPAESGMAHLVNQRMGKKQSMHWSAEGAHQLLQGRCAVLDGELEKFFREWFPGFRENPGSLERAM